MNENEWPTHLTMQGELNKEGFGMITFSNPDFKPKDIITYDFAKGEHLFVHAGYVLPIKDKIHYVYLVRALNKDKFNPRYLYAGTEYYKCASIN